MDYKSGYTDSVKERREQSSSDANLADKIAKGEARAAAYGDNWQEVDIDDVVKKFAPGSTPEHKDGKIIYTNAEDAIAIVVDVGGGYLRIEDLTARTGKQQYLGLDGKSAHNYTDTKGKQHGRSRAQYNAATHFKIKKRKPRG